MKDLNNKNFVLILIVAIVGIVAVFIMLIISSVNNNNLYITVPSVPSVPDSSGFAVHPLYAGFALPFAYSGVNTYLQFSDVSTAVSRVFDVSDTVIYRYGYVSYDGQAWQQFTLTTSNAVSSDWIYTKATTTVAFTPAQLRMSLSRNVSNNTYVVVYSCSRTTSNTWDCHDGWQIIKLDAKITTQTTTSVSSCNDGKCDIGETCSTCPADCGTCQSYTRTFYVSSSTGNDNTGDGSINNPWKTISKVNAQTFKPGDAILFKRGDTWYGTLTISSSGSANAPITYGAYGSGDKPIITGFTTITGWTNYGSGIYSKAVSAASVPSNMVTVDGVNTGKGQYPKAGNWLYNTAVGTGYITDNSLPSSPNWAGAQIFMKTEGYRWNHGTITSQATHQINYIQQGDGSWSGGNGYPGWGFFIDNDLRTLTTINGIAPQLGEWFHDGTTFYMYFGGVDPTTKVVKVATLDNAVVCSQSYINIDSISFIGFNGDHTLGGQSAVGLSGSHYVSVTNCEIGFVGASGTFPGEHTTYDNCWIHDINGNAILGQNYNYLTLTNSIIENIGLIYSMSGGWYARGMAMNLLDGTNAFIQYNIFRHIGSFGAYIGGAPNVIVDKNLFDDCVSKAFDAGAIYVNQESPNRTISNNILINTGYSFEGTTDIHPDIWDAAPGIYLDTPNDGITVTGNTCAGTKNGPGIMISASHNNTFFNNTLYNNFEGLQILSTIPTSLTANLQFTNNKVIAASAGQLLTIIYVEVGSIPTFGFTTASGDIYARLIDDGVDQDWLTREPDINGGHNQYQTYASWLSRSGETGSTFSSVTATSSNDILFEYNAAKTDKVITLNGNYKDVKGTAYSGSVTLAPYTSIVLIKN